MEEAKNPNRLKKGNVLRSLSLPEEDYKELKKRSVDLGLPVSVLVARLIAGFLRGNYSLGTD